MSRDSSITRWFGGGVFGSFDDGASLKRGSGPYERDEVGALTARHRAWEDSINLNAIAIPAC